MIEPGNSKTMDIMRVTLLIFCLGFTCLVNASNQTFQSGEHRVQLVELYSSQGCSSCPPAEKWLNQFTRNPNLWNFVIPMVFHVDYWNYLGWEDPYADAAFSARQREFKRQGLSRSVYTPGFMVNGKEWRGWFQGRSLPSAAVNAGNLEVILDEDRLDATFDAFADHQQLNIAILGFGIKTQVKAGENRRKTLAQEFVVLSYKQVDPHQGTWTTFLDVPDNLAKHYALVAWITQPGSLEPIQATGGYLNADNFIAAN